MCLNKLKKTLSTFAVCLMVMCEYYTLVALKARVYIWLLKNAGLLKLSLAKDFKCDIDINWNKIIS